MKFFLFADDGYPPYGNPLVTTPEFAAKNPDAVRGFVRATMQGWRDYLKNPAPGNALIKQANPKMDDARIAYAIERMTALDLLGSGDATASGTGTMTKPRWRGGARRTNSSSRARFFRPRRGRQAFTTRIVDGPNVLPA